MKSNDFFLWDILTEILFSDEEEDTSDETQVAGSLDVDDRD